MKTLLWIAALLAVGALCFALQEHGAASRAREQSSSLRPHVIRLEGHLNLRRAALQRKQARLAESQKSAAASSAAGARISSLNEETAALDAGHVTMIGAWNEALQDLRSAVDAERRKATGEPAVDLALPSGTVLRGKTVKRSGHMAYHFFPSFPSVRLIPLFEGGSEPFAPAKGPDSA